MASPVHFNEQVAEWHVVEMAPESYSTYILLAQKTQDWTTSYWSIRITSHGIRFYFHSRNDALMCLLKHTRKILSNDIKNKDKRINMDHIKEID